MIMSSADDSAGMAIKESPAPSSAGASSSSLDGCRTPPKLKRLISTSDSRSSRDEKGVEGLASPAGRNENVYLDSSSYRDDMVHFLFDIPLEESLHADYYCAVHSGPVPWHGRLYLTNAHICFYSNLFGKETKLKLALTTLTNVKRRSTVWALPWAIEMRCTDTDKRHIFTGFKNSRTRNKCYKTLMSILDGTFEGTEGALPLSKSSKSCEETSAEEPRSSPSFSASEDADDRGPPTPEEMELTMRQEHDQLNFATLGEFPLSVQQFFDTFINDDAQFSLTAFHEKLNDKEIEIDEWTDTESHHFGRSRTLRFRTKVKNPPPFTKSTTRVEITQRFRALYSKRGGNMQLDDAGGAEMRLFCVDSATRTKDVPFCDSFHCEDSWLVEPVDDLKDGAAPRCKVTIRIGVKFSRSSYLRKVIESRASSESKQAFETWVKMATEFLSSEKETQAAAEGDARNAEMTNKLETAADGATRGILIAVLVLQIVIVFLFAKLQVDVWSIQSALEKRAL